VTSLKKAIKGKTRWHCGDDATLPASVVVGADEFANLFRM
jgi:hypothetical protein